MGPCCVSHVQEEEPVSPAVAPRVTPQVDAKAAAHNATEATADNLPTSGPKVEASSAASGPQDGHSTSVRQAEACVKAPAEEAGVEELGDEVLDGVEVPLELMCPITHKLLHDPVIAMYDHFPALVPSEISQMAHRQWSW